MKTICFENENKFIKASTDYILSEALSNITQKGFFTIGLTGGSTPVKIYKMLTALPYKQQFPWDKTYFFLSDERVLSSENNQSNIFMISQTLFSKINIPEKNKILPDIGLKDPKKIASNYEKKIKDFFKKNQPSFDLLLLGMGLDCHTASMFPNDNIWRNNKKLVISTSKPLGEPEVYRISISLSLINQSKNILMLISGKDKRNVANKLLKNINGNKNPAKSPIYDIKNSGEFIWHIN